MTFVISYGISILFYPFNNIYCICCRFDQCAISSLSLKAVEDAGYERMTEVQEATLPIILQGQ